MDRLIENNYLCLILRRKIISDRLAVVNQFQGLSLSYVALLQMMCYLPRDAIKAKDWWPSRRFFFVTTSSFYPIDILGILPVKCT